MEIGRLTFGPEPAPAAAPAGREQASRRRRMPKVPARPPVHVRDGVRAAAARAAELAERERELHFDTDPDTGLLIVQVRDLEGNVIRTLLPSQALQIMSRGQL